MIVPLQTLTIAGLSISQDSWCKSDVCRRKKALTLPVKLNRAVSFEHRIINEKVRVGNPMWARSVHGRRIPALYPKNMLAAMLES